MKPLFVGQSIRLLAAAVIAAWALLLPGLASAQDVSVHLNIRGEKAVLNGNQTTSVGEWARFDLAFGHGRSQIIVGSKKDPLARSSTSFSADEPERQTPELTAAVSIEVTGQTAEGYSARVLIRTGTKKSGDWKFTQQEDTVVIPTGEAYEFDISDPAANLEYRAALSIEGSDQSARPHDPCQGEVTPGADFRVAYSLNRAEETTTPQIQQEASTAGLSESGDRQAKFANVVHLKGRDSCYHYITLTLKDLKYRSCRILAGTLHVHRSTVFGSDSPIDAQRYSADRIFEDNYQTEIRLANGIPVEIVIPSDENTQFPYAVNETFTIVGRW